MADTPTPPTLDTSGTPESTSFLPPQSTTPAATVSTEDGWEVEDTGRVRGDTFESMVKAEREVAARADGSDPSVLGDPDVPAPDLSDDTDAGVVANAMDPDGNALPAAKKKDDGQTRGKLRMSKRVETLKSKIDEETRTRRELERGNIELARRLLEGRQPVERRDDAAEAPRQERPRRPDGTFAAKADRTDPEPKIPEKPKRPSWAEYEAADKPWAEYNDDLAKYDEAREAYLEAVSEHKAWQVRQDLSGEIAKRDRQMSAAAQRERAEAAFTARRDVVRREYGEERYNAVVENWKEFDEAGYQSDALETLFKLHEAGPRLLAVLGENIEKAAALADRDWTMEVFDGIMALEDPAPVLLALADDPEAFERIASLPRSKAVAALGALSGRLEAAGPRAHGSRPAKVSKAPAPIRPVGGRREGGSTRHGDAAFSEDAPLEDYIRDTNARLSGRS